MKINRSNRELLRLDRDGNCEKARIVYVTEASPDAAAAAEAVRRNAPERIGAARRRGAEITAAPGGGLFEVTVNYDGDTAADAPRRQRRAGDRRWRFLVTSDYATRSDALATVRSVYRSGSARIDPGTRVDWNGRAGRESVSGCVRVLEPRFCEICRATFRPASLNTAYKRRAAEVVGKVNAAVFHHWAPGEVLLESIIQGEIFHNASGEELCDVVFHFAIRPNGARRCAGQLLENVDGWDYVWAVTGSDPGNGTELVTSLHVSRIYERTLFNALEI
ncbi:MAG: hypothetical protein MR051_03710 [Lentisphaeria bacterium]|nr:hypothetical protein [Lentisphaeria bacterium]